MTHQPWADLLNRSGTDDRMWFQIKSKLQIQDLMRTLDKEYSATQSAIKSTSHLQPLHVSARARAELQNDPTRFRELLEGAEQELDLMDLNKDDSPLHKSLKVAILPFVRFLDPEYILRKYESVQPKTSCKPLPDRGSPERQEWIQRATECVAPIIAIFDNFTQSWAGEGRRKTSALGTLASFLQKNGIATSSQINLIGWEKFRTLVEDDFTPKRPHLWMLAIVWFASSMDFIVNEVDSDRYRSLRRNLAYLKVSDLDKTLLQVLIAKELEQAWTVLVGAIDNLSLALQCRVYLSCPLRL